MLVLFVTEIILTIERIGAGIISIEYTHVECTRIECTHIEYIHIECTHTSMNWDWNCPFYSYSYPSNYYQFLGQIKLDIDYKEADVFINGALAGESGKLKTMWVYPDNYTIEIRMPGFKVYEEKVFVIAGKTVYIKPIFIPEDEK